MESTHDQHQSVWQWRSHISHDTTETWETFSQQDTDKIERAQASYSNSVILERNAIIYYVDLLKNTQTNTETGRTRPLQQVKSGSTWSFQEYSSPESTGNESEQWIAFSRNETAKLEAALFAGDDCVILERSLETYYVDILRWTMANLTTNTTHAVKVTTDHSDLAPKFIAAAPPPPKGEKIPASIELADPKPSPRISAWGASESSQRTTSTTSAGESESSFYESEELTAPFSSSNVEIMWLWQDEHGLWATYDGHIASTIEATFAKGETGVVVERGSSGASYYLDLVDMTQTNMSTGYSRTIQRREGW